MKFMGNIEVLICGLIGIVAIYYSIRIEKYKKIFNIQTYREILAFVEGEHLDEAQKIKSMESDRIRNFY